MMKLLLGLGYICVLPLGLGILLMLLYLAYCVVFAWLAIIPIFKRHFRFMCGVWYTGLAIVSKTWKLGIVGCVLLLISN